MRLVAVALVCTSVAVAHADPAPRFEVIDRDGAVEIIARDIKAVSTTIKPVRSRLEVPIAATESIPKLLPAGDETVRVVELEGRSRRVLSVKLAMERPEVQALAKLAQAIQIGDDLHILVPRELPAAGQTITLPEPTLPPQLAAKAAAIAPVPTIETKPAAPRAETTHTPAAGVQTPATPASPAQTAPATGTKPGPIARAPEPRDNTPILLALTLAAFGSAVWLKRRNGKKPVEPSNSIEVVAQKSLGAKAKIVWVRAGERDMIVAVSPQSVRTLGQWKRTDAQTASARSPLPEAVTHAPPADRSSSPAVAGILKLRARTSTNHDMLVDEGAADDAWAKEILAATGARR